LYSFMISNMDISARQDVFESQFNLRFESVDRNRIRQNPFPMAKNLSRSTKSVFPAPSRDILPIMI
jgi:hypothetical protein